LRAASQYSVNYLRGLNAGRGADPGYACVNGSPDLRSSRGEVVCRLATESGTQMLVAATQASGKAHQRCTGIIALRFGVFRCS
jgi:hypothetical protein